MADDLTLASDFAPATREEWLAAVEKAIKGADFDKTLVSTTDDGIRIEPLYTGEDVATAADEAGFPAFDPLLRGAVVAARPDGAWDIRTSIGHPDPQAANRQALHDLANGATSIEFVVRSPDDLPVLLRGIVLEAAPIALRAGAGAVAAAGALLDLVDPGSGPSGCLGVDPIGTLATTGTGAAIDTDLAQRVAAALPNMRTFLASGATVADAGASEAQEVAYLLATATAYLRAMTDGGMSLEAAARQIAFEVAADVDIFATVAKIRALRYTWACVLRESGATIAGDEDRLVSIIATSSYRTLTVVDPWVNLLRGTAACLGAVLGGADTVTIAPFDAAAGLPGDLGRRLARNTQLILQDESGIGRVLDPAGGSWYIESLTDELARRAWDGFQRIEAAGGPVAAMALIAEEIAEVAAARDAAIARRKRPITGVSEFPLLGEQPPRPEPAPPAATGGPLARRRLAEPFEALRSRGEAAGERATVFLANLGPIATHTARATFAANLLATGGIRAVGDDGHDDAGSAAHAFGQSGATIACICSSDEKYAELAEPVAAALRAAGARRIYLAGRAVVAGVDENIGVGVDALDVLGRLHEELEIA